MYNINSKLVHSKLSHLIALSAACDAYFITVRDKATLGGGVDGVDPARRQYKLLILIGTATQPSRAEPFGQDLISRFQI